MDSAWSYDDNEAVSINGFARESLFFFWTMHHFISLHASAVTNNLPRQMEHPSNIFSRTHLGKSPESSLKSEGAVCNCRLLAKSYFQVKGKLLSSRGRRVPYLWLCCCFVLTWKSRLALMKLSPLSTVHPELFSDGGGGLCKKSTFYLLFRSCIYFQT